MPTHSHPRRIGIGGHLRGESREGKGGGSAQPLRMKGGVRETSTPPPNTTRLRFRTSHRVLGGRGPFIQTMAGNQRNWEMATFSLGRPGRAGGGGGLRMRGDQGTPPPTPPVCGFPIFLSSPGGSSYSNVGVKSAKPGSLEICPSSTTKR